MGKTTILGLLCLGFAGCASDEQRDFYDGCRPEVGPPRAGCPDQGTVVERPDAAPGDAAVEADAAPSVDASVVTDVASPEDAATPPDAGPPPGEGIGGPCVDPTDCQSGFCLDSTFARSVAMDEDVEIPGGYCADLTCMASDYCGAESACIDLRASGVDIPFKACLRTCAGPEGPVDQCRADQECFCDAEGDVTDVEGNRGLCLCLPGVLAELLAGE